MDLYAKVYASNVMHHCTYLLLSCSFATLKGELENSQERPQSKAQRQNKEHPLQVV